jgi:hypothetical protein
VGRAPGGTQGMIRYGLLAVGLALALVMGDAQAQTATQPSTPQPSTTQPPPSRGSQGSTTRPLTQDKFQSLRPSQTPCGPGSQSVRVCNDDFRSCSSVCVAQTLDPSFDTTGCSLKCCTQFKACLSIRGCATLTLECLAGPYEDNAT